MGTVGDAYDNNLIRGFVIAVSVVGGGLFLIGTCIALGGWAASKPRRLSPTAPVR